MQANGYTRTTWCGVLAAMVIAMFGFERPDWAAFIGFIAIVGHLFEMRR